MKRYIHSLKQHFDAGTLTVMLITFVLFVVALFVKGMTQDLLLEAGVFLVSVKLLMMTYRNKEEADALHTKLDQIIKKLDEPDGQA